MMEERELILTIVLLTCGASCELKSTATSFFKKPGTLHQSPHVWTELVICQGKPCSTIVCAKACVQTQKCTVFSRSPTKNTCIMSWRPDNDSTNYETVDSNWDTYYRECPTEKGYVLHTGHYPPLCLRLDEGPLLQPTAKSACLAEGANLVRIKSLEVYDIVKDMLNEAGFSKDVYVGADDLEHEGQFLWNDGTALPLGSDLWLSPSEGYNGHEDCTAVSPSWKIFDTTCLLYPKGFVCQYDL